MPILKNTELELNLQKNGFVILDTNLLAEIEQLKAYISQHYQLSSTDFYYSLMNGTYPQNAKLKDFIKETLFAFYDSFFVDYRTITESFLSKPAHTISEFMLHQDWCYTDEKKYAVYNIWIPMDDVTTHNGAMCFIPGSHLWLGNLRSATYPTSRLSINDFPAELVQTVSLKKGQALLFHPAVFHGSFPNHTDKNRLVVTATLLEKEAPFLCYYENPEKDKALVFQLPEDALLQDLESIAMQGKPSAPLVDEFNYVHQLPTVADLLSHYDQ